MRKVLVALGLASGLAACSTTPHPLVPDTAQGPASYVCYSSAASSPEEIRGVAQRQCGKWGHQVTGLIGQSWTPLRCGVLTPTVAAFQCGGYGGMILP